MRERSSMQTDVAIVEVVDVGVVAMRHELKIAKGENSPLGPAGGSAGVEQPCLVVGRAQSLEYRIGREQRGIILRRCRDDAGLPRCEDLQWRELGRDVRGAETSLASGVGKDERDLLLMKSYIHRYGNHARAPNAVENLQVLAAVLHRDADAATRSQTQTPAQSAGDAAYIIFQLGIGYCSGIGRDCGAAGQAFGDAPHILGEVHNRPPLCFHPRIANTRTTCRKQTRSQTAPRSRWLPAGVAGSIFPSLPAETSARASPGCQATQVARFPRTYQEIALSKLAARGAPRGGQAEPQDRNARPDQM